jgi:hypothetical protein
VTTHDLKAGYWVPVTPGGTVCTWLCAPTEQEAIDNLLHEASHMPYDGWDKPGCYGFKERGYTIEQVGEARDESEDSI